MYAFLCNFTPRSVNAQKKVAYYRGLVDAFWRYNRTGAAVTGSLLYGFVYYFHKVKTQLDADNLSKPVWDALENEAYADDRQVRFRSSGLFDLGSEGIEVVDLSNMPDRLLEDFLKMIDDGENHILYVELGKFDYDLFQFGYEI